MISIFVAIHPVGRDNGLGCFLEILHFVQNDSLGWILGILRFVQNDNKVF